MKLWPLFRYARDDARGELRWSALGPLIEYTRTPERRDLRIRPLLWVQQRPGALHDDRAEILYPLASSRWQENHQSFRFLLFTYRSEPRPRASPQESPQPSPEPSIDHEPPRAAWKSRFTLFPLIFYREGPTGVPHLSVLPFYLDQEDFLGFERVRAILFPAYLQLTEPRVERRFYGFPFVSTVGGADGRGFRVWPFFGTKEIVGRERTRYVLWPFHLESDRLVPGYGWEHRRINFPVYAAVEGAGRESSSWGTVAYTHTVDTRHGTEVTGTPWPLVLRARHLGEEEYYTWRLAPIYGRSERDGISSRFYAWPAYREKSQDVEDFHYRRRDVMLLLWRRQELTSAASGRRERLLTLFPAFRAAEENERRFGQAPAVFDSLMPKNRGVLALWAPLYGLVRWDTGGAGATDWMALWGLLAEEDGRLQGPWHLRLGAPEAIDGG